MIAREKMKCNMFVNTSDVGIGVSRHLSDSSMSRSVADPGFSQEGANAQGRGAENIFIKCSPKLHEIEKIWSLGGRVLGAPP